MTLTLVCFKVEKHKSSTRNARTVMLTKSFKQKLYAIIVV